MNLSRLSAWLRRIPSAAVTVRALFTGVGGDENVWKWELFESKGGKSKEVARVSEEVLSADILSVLRGDTEDRNANCRYRIEAVDEAENVLATIVHIERHPENLDPKNIRSDASSDGVVTQLLRHNEAIMKLLVTAFRDIQGGYQTLLNIQANQITDMRGREKALQAAMLDASKVIDEDSASKAEALQKLTDALVTEVLPRAGDMFDIYKQRQTGEQPQ